MRPVEKLEMSAVIAKVVSYATVTYPHLTRGAAATAYVVMALWIREKIVIQAGRHSSSKGPNPMAAAQDADLRTAATRYAILERNVTRGNHAIADSGARQLRTVLTHRRTVALLVVATPVPMTANGRGGAVMVRYSLTVVRSVTMDRFVRMDPPLQKGKTPINLHHSSANAALMPTALFVVSIVPVVAAPAEPPAQFILLPTVEA